MPSPEEDERVSPDGAATLTGVPASRGTYVGTARIVTSPAEFGHLARGDVLVAVSTSPSWTPLFQIAGAVVTQIGSPASHAAIVAREYGVPAVVALDRITARLVDGQRVRVDGTRGTVTIVELNAEEKQSVSDARDAGRQPRHAVQDDEACGCCTVGLGRTADPESLVQWSIGSGSYPPPSQTTLRARGI